MNFNGDDTETDRARIEGFKEVDSTELDLPEEAKKKLFRPSLLERVKPRAADALLVIVLLAAQASPAEVRTPKKPVTNEYHGVTVRDDYQWLENGADPAVRRWSALQDQRARAVLDKLPTRSFLEDRLQRLWSQSSANYFALSWRPGKLFLLKLLPTAPQPVLITLNSPDDLAAEKVVLDPNQLGASSSTTIDWFVPSPNGKLVAVSLSQSGTEEGTLSIYETATSRKLADAIPRVQCSTGGGGAAWNADGSGLFYTRYPRPGERPDEELSFHQQIYFHKLGAPAEQDTYELGKEFPRIAAITLEARPDGRYLLANVANGNGGDHAHYLRDPAGHWKQITRYEDRIQQVEFGRDPLYIEWPKDDALYLCSTREAPKGKILRLPLTEPALKNAATVLPEGTNVIRSFQPAASGLWMVFLKGGGSEVAFVDFLGKSIRVTNYQTLTAVQQLLVTQGDDALFRTETYTEPFTWWRCQPNQDEDRIERTALHQTAPVSFADVEAVRVTATSKDGTPVPMNIIRKKGTRLNGENPTLLAGSGGFGANNSPEFDFTRRVWLDQGGVFAVANLRGGGQHGEEWHNAGKLTNKQNAFDDFAACAAFLIRSNYTKPSKLAIEGRGKGGLLMGALLTQHPGLMEAAVSRLGIYDMLRAERDPKGAFNATEFGTVQDPAQFKALYAYSPYHHVTNRTRYPAVLLLAGENDGGANRGQSRKMTARLQAASSSKRPVLLRTSSDSGHGMALTLNDRLQELADVYAFLCEQLGVEYSLVDRGPWTGAVTPTSAVVKAKVAHEGMTARLALSRNPQLNRPVYSLPLRAATNHHNLVAFPLENLQPGTAYYYALEIDGRLDRKSRGEFRTFPEDGPASFQIAFASCARTGSTSDVFDRIREHQPLFYMNMGDFHYLDIQTNSQSLFRAAYDRVLASPQQADLYRRVPFVYMWDDHDYGGNNSNRKAASRQAARLAYDEYVPHYPLAAGADDVPIYQSFAVGRVKFILSDLRSARDDVRDKESAEKSMMGAKQKAWFKRELLAANGKYPLICWVSSVPWIGEPGTNFYHLVKTNHYGYIHHTNLVESDTSRTNRNRAPADEDHWSMFTTERREIADFIKSNHIRGVCILHGDSHMLAADDGRSSDYATGGGAPIPVMCAAPLDQDPSLKGGPYSQGVYRVKSGETCFGLLTVTDKGGAIDVAFSGRNHKDEEKISLKFTVPSEKTMARKK